MKQVQKFQIYIETIFFLSFSFLLYLYFYSVTKISELQYKNKKSKNLKFLVIQQAKIGDVVCTTPMFREIKKKYPDSFLGVVIIPMTRGVVENNPYIDEIIEYDREKYAGISGNLKFIKEIKKRNFDWSFNVLSAGVAPNVMSFWAGVPNRVITTSKYWWTTTRIASWFSNYRLEYKRHTLALRHYLKHLQFIGIEKTQEKKDVFITSDEQNKINSLLEAKGVKDDDLVIALSITAGNRLKEWPEENFLSLAKKLKEELKAKIIFLGSEKDQDRISNLLKNTNSELFINLAGLIELKELAALLKKCDLYISVDTGPIYIANAVGVSVVDITGPIDWREQPPLGEKCEIVCSKAKCAPCSFVLPPARQCVKGDISCLKSIGVNDVFKAVKTLLEGKKTLLKRDFLGKKIAIFSSTVDHTTGTGNWITEVAVEYQKLGIDFVVFAPKSEQNMNYNVNFEVRYILPENTFSAKGFRILPYIFADINLEEFNLLHSISEFPYSYLAARLAKKYNIPLIITGHGTFAVRPLSTWPEKYFLKYSYRQAKEITVPSKFTRDMIEKYAGRDFARYNVKIIHNGVHSDKFNINPNISDLQAKYKGKKILLTVGNLKARKGHDLVIKALEKVCKEYSNIRYLIMGEGNWRDYLENLVQEKDLQDYVEFLGALSEEEKIRYFHFCDIYIHTPRAKYLSFEGFGIVYLEAGVCGKPVIAADAGGIKDAVVHNQTGLIAGNENVDQIAEHIITLLKNENLSQKFGKAGLQYAKEHDWSIIVENFIRIYEKYI